MTHLPPKYRHKFSHGAHQDSSYAKLLCLSLGAHKENWEEDIIVYIRVKQFGKFGKENEFPEIFSPSEWSPGRQQHSL